MSNSDWLRQYATWERDAPNKKRLEDAADMLDSLASKLSSCEKDLLEARQLAYTSTPLADLAAARDEIKALSSRLDAAEKSNERLRNLAAGMFWSGGNFDDKTMTEVIALGLDARSRLDSIAALATPRVEAIHGCNCKSCQRWREILSLCAHSSTAEHDASNVGAAGSSPAERSTVVERRAPDCGHAQSHPDCPACYPPPSE